MVIIIKVKNLWSTAVPSRPSTMRELARPCLNDINDDCHDDDDHHNVDDYHHNVDDHHHNVDDYHHNVNGHLPCSLTSDAIAAGWIGCWLPFTDKC